MPEAEEEGCAFREPRNAHARLVNFMGYVGTALADDVATGYIYVTYDRALGISF